MLIGRGSLTTVDHNSQQVMINLSENGLCPMPGMAKSLNAPAMSKVLSLSHLQLHGVEEARHMCLECHSSIATPGHFKKHVACSMCRYATACNNSYANHMKGFHAGNIAVRRKITATERGMPSIMYCSCGFSSNFGNSVGECAFFSFLLLPSFPSFRFL